MVQRSIPYGFSFWVGMKCMRQAVRRIAARRTTTHNHTLTNDALVVGKTKVLGLSTLPKFRDFAPFETRNNSRRPHCAIRHTMKR